MKISISSKITKIKERLIKSKTNVNAAGPNRIIEAIKNAWKKIVESKVTANIFSIKSLKILVYTLAVISLIQVVFAVFIYGYKSENPKVKFFAKIFPYPVVIVNQDVVTYDQYLTEKNYIHHFYESTDQTKIDYANVDKQIMEQLIENRLISTEALIHHVKVEEGDVNAAINQIIDQNGGQDKVEKVLSDLYGLTLEQFKDLVRTQMLRDNVSNEIIMKVTARHILIRVNRDAPQDQVDAAKKKIDEIKAQISGGLSFEDAAKKYSEDTGSAENGGLLEPFATGDMVDEFSAAAFSAPVGEIVGPIRTDFGWHIIKVESTKGKEKLSFGDWLNNLKKKSWIIKLIK